MAVGRHRADSEDGQRHDDGPRAAVPRPAAGNRDGDGTTPGAGAQEKAASTPADGVAQLRPRRSSGRNTRSAAIKHKPASPKSVRRNHDLLGWGLFLTLTSAAAMMWAGIDWPVTAVCGFLLLLSFTAVWYVSSTPPAASAQEAAPAKETAATVPAEDVAPAEAREPVAVPAAAAPAPSQAAPSQAAPAPSQAAQSQEAPAEAPLTRKQMRAADPTTGVMPVVSVFARKPSPANATSPARTAASPAPSQAEPAVPKAPAGQLLQGIDTGAAAADSRRARRAAAAAASAGTKTKSSGKSAPVSTAASASDGGSSGSAKALAADPAKAPAADPAKAPAADPTKAPAADSAAEAGAVEAPAATNAPTAENGDGESRWTRVFGPPETGQLPVQRYIAAASAVDASSGSSTDRQQRSHSSL